MTCLLLLKGADPNIANKSGITPLTIAERMGFTKIISVLLICGAISLESKHPQNSKRLSIMGDTKKKEKHEIHGTSNQTQGLFGSFSKKAFNGTEKIDEEGKILVQSSMETGIMILPDAAYLGFQTQLISVIRQDTLKDADEAGSTVLMKAAYAGHHVLVKDLLDLGCDPDAMDKSGNTSLVWAVLSGKGRVVQILYESGSNIDGAVPYSKKVGIKIKGQMTPLIAAAYHGHLSISKFLLKEKCNINLRCGKGEGKSAIMVAACARKPEIVKLLIQYNAILDPKIDTWLTKGSNQMKKSVADKNAWVCLEGENALYRKDKASIYDLSSVGQNTISSKENVKNLGNKSVYYCSEDQDPIDEIYELLQNTVIAGPNVLKTPSPLETEINNENSPVKSSGIQPRTGAKRNPMFRNGLNLDVSCSSC